jgi:hypothetical protein
MTFDEAAKILEARGRVSYTGSKSLTACCPAHDDTRPSFSMSEKSGKLLMYCFAGCSYQDILDALNLAEVPDTPMAREVKRAEARKPITSTQKWPVCDVDGKHVATLVRLNHEDGSKTPFWTLPDGTKGLGGMRTEDLPLYGVHLFPIYDEEKYDGPIYVCEGPKDADALIDKGIPAVGTLTGAASIPSDVALRVLVGRNIVLWPDNDEAGRRHMQRIAERLTILAQTLNRKEN